MNIIRSIKKFLRAEDSLYYSPNASEFEKHSFELAWPYTNKRRDLLFTDFTEIRQLILDYYGLEGNPGLSRIDCVASLLESLKSSFDINYLSVEPKIPHHLGDSGLTLLCYENGVDIRYPSKWFRSQLIKTSPKRIIILTHLLPAGKTSLSTLLQRIFSHKYSLILTIASTCLVLSLISLIPTYLTENIFNSIIPEGQSFLMIQLGFFILAIHLVTRSFNLFNQLLGVRIELFLGYQTISVMFYHILQSTDSFFEHFSLGDLQQRIGSVHSIRRVLQSSFVSAITAIFAIILNLGLVYFKSSSFYLLLVLLVLSLAGPIIDIIATIFETYFRYKKLVLAGLLNDSILEPLQSITTVRSLGCEEKLFSNYSSIRIRIAKLEIKLHLIRTFIAGIDVIISTFIISIFLFAFSSPFLTHILFPASKASSAEMSQGYILLLLSAFTTINAAVRSFSKSFLSLANVYPDVIRLRPLLRASSKSERLGNIAPHISGISITFDKSKVVDIITSESSFLFNNSSLLYGRKKDCFELMSFLYGEEQFAATFHESARQINGKYVLDVDYQDILQQKSSFIADELIQVSSSILDNITDREPFIDNDYFNECLLVCGISESIDILESLAYLAIQASPSQNAMKAKIMICRSLYMRFSPILIYGWFDYLPLNVCSSIIDFCHIHNLLLICYSERQDIMLLFNDESKFIYPRAGQPKPL